ncbi:FAD-binding protein [Arthrobacter sp. zg-Y20]|uniref:D-arabinono-1,4-lactone oxidase n=1 Tax=unclassified Arthrobacter TaxID=235627 RepID=UPI001D143034|nr:MULTISPECIES: D-arabinono-1,4-lactone oxidase [unclassified Arthrobacter]MCC3274984.1 FAD-binding protein [Arthrobacter sp. zg-Y20]MDK1315141.1 D-arabinono-1,4-lactone oxidase [Arthrobacter sp. zg.Y20]WIB04983.1 D-arabinono-1,4-lactone oxidase [Arthrobacter sp. zg-Y20]
MSISGGKTARPWRNWGRSVSAVPLRMEQTDSAAALQRSVAAAAAAGSRVKAVGAGHSFTAIAATDGVLLDLKRLQGLIGVEPGTGRVRLHAGTRLHRIPDLLAPYGLAMPNLGDIDRQSIAGAVSTGTHGTGAGFGGLSTQVAGLTLIQPDGGVLNLADGDPLLPAAALGLGALGVIADVTLQCVPAFVLHAEERSEPLAEVLQGLPDRVKAADHFEFYWFPHTDRAATKTNTRLPGTAQRRPLGPAGRWINETLLSNTVFRAACAAGVAVPAVIPAVNKTAARLLGGREYSDASPRVFTQRRTVRFREMEYAVPADRLPAVFDALRQVIDRHRWRISFPVEVRWAAADDRWLSTAYGRDTAYLAVHRYYREDCREYFAAVEAVMLAHGGRPHWGKMHSLDASALAERYPRFADFLAVRDQLDPDRVFGNAYLERVLGP